MKFHFKDVDTPIKDWLCSQCLSHIPIGVSHHTMSGYAYHTSVSLRLCSSCKEHCKVILSHPEFVELVDIPNILLPWAEYTLENKDSMGETNVRIAENFITRYYKNLEGMDERQFDVYGRSTRITVRESS